MRKIGEKESREGKMKTIIYYFSGTGNNLFVAKQIAKNLPGTEIRPIRELEKNKEIQNCYDWVGYIGPSYFSHIPPYMMSCMEGVKYAEHQKIFLVCGCGGNRGMAIQDMRQQVNASGKESSLEYMVIQPGNYILSYGAFPDIYQKLTCLIANRKVKKIAEDIQNNRNRKNLKPGIFYKDSSEERLQKSIADFSAIGKQYQVNDKCIGCGMCEKVCPVGNITIKEGKVIFGDHCNQCMACIQWCGQRAIHFDEKEEKRKRYHNSNISASELWR